MVDTGAAITIVTGSIAFPASVGTGANKAGAEGSGA
jgi:hypothetical protein